MATSILRCRSRRFRPDCLSRSCRCEGWTSFAVCRWIWRVSSEYLQRIRGGKFFYFVTRETVDPAARLHARMLFYDGEDPATGSAAGCATAWMVAHGVAEPDERVLIEQGVEMLRPSRIFVRAVAPWITEWLTFASEEMLWKSCAAKFFSEAAVLQLPRENTRPCTSAKVFQWGEFTIGIGGTLQRPFWPLGFCLALSSPYQPKSFLTVGACITFRLPSRKQERSRNEAETNNPLRRRQRTVPFHPKSHAGNPRLSRDRLQQRRRSAGALQGGRRRSGAHRPGHARASTAASSSTRSRLSRRKLPPFCSPAKSASTIATPGPTFSCPKECTRPSNCWNASACCWCASAAPSAPSSAARWRPRRRSLNAPLEPIARIEQRRKSELSRETSVQSVAQRFRTAVASDTSCNINQLDACLHRSR